MAFVTRFRSQKTASNSPYSLSNRRLLVGPREQARFLSSKQIGGPLLRDRHVHADVREIVKCDHIARAHTNAAVARRLANASFLRRPMNVNTTLVCAEVLFCLSA